MAQQAWTGVKYLKSLVNVEKHPCDVNVAAQTPDNTTGLFNLLTVISQGDNDTDRQGNSILARSVNINLKYQINASASHTTIRTILFWDKECNGATPTISDILQTTSVMANYNHNTASQYQILADYRVNLSISGQQETTRRIYRKLQRHVHFDGASGTIGDIQDYALWLFFVSDEAANTPSVQARSQLLFIDN